MSNAARARQKTVRFTRVVEWGGKPHPHTQWVPIEKDPELKRALREHRVMLVEPSTDGKAEWGHVVSDHIRSSVGQILIFPKSLRRFQDARVVGIKFDLLEQPKLESAPKETSLLHRPKGRSKVAPRTSRAGKSKAETQAASRGKVVAFPKRAPAQPVADESTTDPGRVLEGEVRAAMAELQSGDVAKARRRLQLAVKRR